MTTIRLARDADLPLFGPIEDAGDTLFVERFGAGGWPPATSGEERAAEPGILLVAEDDGAVVGFTHVVDPEVTLMTYADIPWNAPFYAQHGYVELDVLPEHLQPVWDGEEAFGMSRHGRRVAMVRDLTD